MLYSWIRIDYIRLDERRYNELISLRVYLCTMRLRIKEMILMNRTR